MKALDRIEDAASGAFLWLVLFVLVVPALLIAGFVEWATRPSEDRI